jgi:hypothetical protein
VFTGRILPVLWALWCALAFGEPAGIRRLDAVLDKAATLDEFLASDELKHEYYEALRDYHGGSEKFPRSSFNAIIKQLTDIKDKVPGMKERIWERTPPGRTFSVKPEIATSGRALDGAGWTSYRASWASRLENDMAPLDPERRSEAVAELLQRLSDKRSRFEAELGASGLPKKQKGVRWSEFTESLRADPEVKAAVAFLLSEKLKDPALRDAFDSADADLSLLAFERMRKLTAADWGNLGAGPVPKDLVRFLGEAIPTETALLENTNLFKVATRYSRQGTTVPVGSVGTEPIQFIPVRRMHAIFKGVSVGECVGGNCTYLENLSPERWANSVFEGAEVYHAVQGGSYHGFVQYIPLKGRDGNIFASVDMGAGILRNKALIRDPQTGLWKVSTLFESWLAEAEKHKPAEWTGFMFSENTGGDHADVRPTFTKTDSWVLAPPLGNASDYKHLDQPLIDSIIAVSPKGTSLYYGGNGIFDAGYLTGARTVRWVMPNPKAQFEARVRAMSQEAKLHNASSAAAAISSASTGAGQEGNLAMLSILLTDPDLVVRQRALDAAGRVYFSAGYAHVRSNARFAPIEAAVQAEPQLWIQMLSSTDPLAQRMAAQRYLTKANEAWDGGDRTQALEIYRTLAPILASGVSSWGDDTAKDDALNGYRTAHERLTETGNAEGLTPLAEVEAGRFDARVATARAIVEPDTRLRRLQSLWDGHPAHPGILEGLFGTLVEDIGNYYTRSLRETVINKLVQTVPGDPRLHEVLARYVANSGNTAYLDKWNTALAAPGAATAAAYRAFLTALQGHLQGKPFSASFQSLLQIYREAYEKLAAFPEGTQALAAPEQLEQLADEQRLAAAKARRDPADRLTALIAIEKKTPAVKAAVLEAMRETAESYHSYEYRTENALRDYWGLVLNEGPENGRPVLEALLQSAVGSLHREKVLASYQERYTDAASEEVLKKLADPSSKIYLPGAAVALAARGNVPPETVNQALEALKNWASNPTKARNALDFFAAAKSQDPRIAPLLYEILKAYAYGKSTVDYSYRSDEQATAVKAAEQIIDKSPFWGTRKVKSALAWLSYNFNRSKIEPFEQSRHRSVAHYAKRLSRPQSLCRSWFGMLNFREGYAIAGLTGVGMAGVMWGMVTAVPVAGYFMRDMFYDILGMETSDERADRLRQEAAEKEYEKERQRYESYRRRNDY